MFKYASVSFSVALCCILCLACSRLAAAPAGSDEDWPAAPPDDVSLSAEQLASLPLADPPLQAYFMSGTGGNKVYAVPKLGLAAVVPTENFRRQDAHDLSDRLLLEHILRSVTDLAASPE